MDGAHLQTDTQLGSAGRHSRNTQQRNNRKSVSIVIMWSTTHHKHKARSISACLQCGWRRRRRQQQRTGSVLHYIFFSTYAPHASILWTRLLRRDTTTASSLAVAANVLCTRVAIINAQSARADMQISFCVRFLRDLWRTREEKTHTTRRNITNAFRMHARVARNMCVCKMCT